MKKIIGLIMVVCMLCTGVVYANDYGIIDSNADVNTTMTRAEMAKIVVKLRGSKILDYEATKADTVFDDVKADYPLSNYINRAKEMKLVDGNGDGTFAPDELVTFEQAVKMIVCTLGYEVAVGVAGYPVGYIKVAQQLGLTKGINTKNGESIKIKDIRKLVDNALTTPIMEQTAFGAYVDYHICDGENGVRFDTLETLCFKPSPFYVTDKDNNIILIYNDVFAVVGSPDDSKELYALDFTLTDEGKEKLAKATEVISKADEGENYIKVIACATGDSGAPTVIAKPVVNVKRDSEKFVVQGIDQVKATAFIEAFTKYIKNQNTY